jgi:tight adherence protein B
MGALLLLLLLLLAAAAGAGVLLAFVALARSPAPEGGIRGQLDLAFQGVTERMSQRERRRGRAPLEERLARAGLRLRPSEYVIAQLGCAVALAVLGLARFGVSLVVPVAAVLGLLVPGLFVKFRMQRRLKHLNSQLGDVLSLMANSLKAGHALPQTLEVIAREARPPIAEEFARCVRELQVGGAMEGALNNLARRSGSEDLELMVTAVLVQLTVGGNLAGTLERIAHTIRERVRIKGEIAAATAQGRMSGWIVTLLPISVAVLLFVISPTYFRPMTQQLLGWMMLVGAGLLILTGNLVIRRIVRIDV